MAKIYTFIDWASLFSHVKERALNGYVPEKVKPWPHVVIGIWVKNLNARSLATLIKSQAINFHLEALAEDTGASLDTCRKYYMRHLVSLGRKQAARRLYDDTMLWASVANTALFGGAFSDLLKSEAWKNRVKKDTARSLVKHFA